MLYFLHNELLIVLCYSIIVVPCGLECQSVFWWGSKGSQTWKRLGEGQKGILERRSEAKWGVHVTPLFWTPPCPQFLCQHGVKSTQSEANTNNSHAHRKHPHCGLVVLIFPSSDEFDEFLIYFYLIFFSPHRVVEKVLSLKTLLEETFYQEVIQV